MLDFNENYVTTLYDSCDDLGITEPKFSVYQNYYGNNQPFRCEVKLNFSTNSTSYNLSNIKTFNGEGNSEISAKMDAAKKAIDFLQKYKIEQIAQKYDGRATLFMGSSYEKKLAQKLGSHFAITSNPCLDKEILNRSHIGTHGCISLVEDLYNHF
jgi:hypothetical protein